MIFLRSLRRISVIAVVALSMATVQGQSLNDLTGDAIVSIMQSMSDKCPATAPNGDSWAPLPADSQCGGTPRCDFPKQWCAFKLGADGNPDPASLNCQDLSADCKKAFEETASAGGGGGTSPSPGGATTPPAEGTTPPAAGGSTPGAEATPTPGGTPAPAEGGTSAAPAGSETPPAPTEAPPGGESTPPPQPSPETPPAPSEGTTGGVPMTEPPPETSPAASTGAPVTEAPAPGGSTTGGTSAPSGEGECCNYHEFCCYWASTGQCETNKPFMLQLCRKSCGTCACTGDPIQCPPKPAAECSGTNVLPEPACPCKSGDLVHKDWNPKCSGWAARGDCDKNPDYMKPMCKVSCNVCT